MTLGGPDAPGKGAAVRLGSPSQPSLAAEASASGPPRVTLRVWREDDGWRVCTDDACGPLHLVAGYEPNSVQWWGHDEGDSIPAISAEAFARWITEGGKT